MFHWTMHLIGGPDNYCHTAVVVGHKLYSFAGNNGPIVVHVFDSVHVRWAKLSPLASGRGELPLEAPSGRTGHTAVLVEDIIHVWGGIKHRDCNLPTDYCNVLYTFHVDTHRWFEPKVSGTVPTARYGHSACVLGQVMYIHGGHNIKVFYDSIFKLYTNTMVWSLINTRGTPSPASTYHSATVIGTKMFVFAGRAYGDDHNNDIRVFDTETNCWLSTPSAQLLPEARCGHSAFTYNGELYIFGGRNHDQNQDQTFNILWKLNTETFSWKKVESKGKGPSQTAFMCCCMVGDRVILFGAEWREGESILNDDDLYILELNPSLKMLCKQAVIQYGLEQSELPHNISWELAAMTTNRN